MIRTLCCTLLVAVTTTAAAREVAITIDDLPGPCDYPALRSVTQRLTTALQAEHVPVTAFVISGNCPDLTPAERAEIFNLWRGAGAEFGNHTFSHRGLNEVSLDDYTADIIRAEGLIKAVNGDKPIHYFRSPMLQTGPDSARKEGLEQFLAEHGYTQAPVTFDNSDWMFARIYRDHPHLRDRVHREYLPYLESVVAFFEERAVEVAGREFPQVMLLHANELNAAKLPDLLAMFKRRGYRFITLDQALQDPAYRMRNDYAGPGGFSWIHRWSRPRACRAKRNPTNRVGCNRL